MTLPMKHRILQRRSIRCGLAIFIVLMSKVYASGGPSDIDYLLAHAKNNNYSELRKHWLDDDDLSAHLQKQHELHKVVAAAIGNGDSCASIVPSLHLILGENPFSLFAHVWSLRCAEQMDKRSLAQQHEDFLHGFLQAVMPHGNGQTRDEAIRVSTLYDVGEVLSLADYDEVDGWFELPPGSDEIRYVSWARDEQTGVMREWWFDNQDFLMAWGKHLESLNKDEHNGPLSASLTALSNADSTAAMVVFSEVLMRHDDAERQSKGYAMLQKAVTAGSLYARVLLARYSVLGKGTLPDYDKVIDLLLPAAEKKFPMAQVMLAFCYDTGIGVDRDEAARDNLLQQAAVQLPPGMAYLYMSEFYQDMLALPQTSQAIVRWLQRAVDAGNAKAMTLLGQRYEAGRDVKADPARASALYGSAANAHDPAGMLAYSRLLFSGAGVTKNPALALQWLQQSVAREYPNAKATLGVRYVTGDGIAKDINRGRDLIQAAAQSGDVYGQSILGVLYEQGLGMPRDDDKALAWYTRAALHGSSRAQFNAASLMARTAGNKTGGEKPDPKWICQLYTSSAGDEYQEAYAPAAECFYAQGNNAGYLRAAELFTKAAQQGDVNAQYKLGMMLLAGQGVIRDPVTAFSWIKKSAELNNRDAQRQLGELYRDGLGTEKNTGKAREWLSKAAQAGDSAAASSLQALQ